MVSIDCSNRAAAYIGDTLTAGGGTTVPAYYALVAQAHMAGLGPSDMDFAQLYDCFTPTVLIELEDLGFCAKGEGGSFAASGALAPGGKLPVDTHGGMLSHCHSGNPGSMLALTESVWQLRLQQCARCHQYQFYPRSLCSRCGHTHLD